MKKLLLLAAALIVLGGLYYFLSGDSSSNYLNVMVFSKTEGFRHESIEAGQAAISQLGEKYGFETTVTEDADIFRESNLEKFNVIIFLNTTGDILNGAQELELNRWIQAGGGFVGIHSAADTEYGWPYYNELVGAYFESHPNDPNVMEGSMDRLIDDHISTKHLPERWTRTDEWYSFRDIQPDINVLLNLDETSYKGGTNGENHPIAWYREFDGGRMWYTGLGHTPETFSEPMFLDHLWGGIQYAAGERKPVDYNMANVAPEENRFTKVVFMDNLYEPMELEMLPNGNLIFIQRRGEVMVYDVEKKEGSEVNKLNVFFGLEDGLLGMALDPDFEANKYIYLYYSHPVDTIQILSRFTMKDDYSGIDESTELQMLTVKTQRLECCHSGGSLEFGPDGLLYLATGDNSNPHASDGYAPIDDRPGRSPWDARKSAANANDLRGKVLRIRPEADGYSIPEGNLFPEGTPDTRPEIYVMGCRNPYRLSIDQKNGYLYWGDVGPDASIDSAMRGPKGHDEVNQAREAGFFGWPLFIGDNKPYYDYDFETQEFGEPFDPNAPVNDSRYNTGIQNLPPAQKAFFWYPYDGSKEFPLLGDGGRTAMAGPVFYVDDYPESEKRYPNYFDGKLFIYEWMRGWIIAVTLDEEGNYVRMERFLPKYKFSNPTDIIFGPDGDMYLLEYGTGWFQQNPDARLVHLQYTAGNRKPVAQIDTENLYGQLPLNVVASGLNSVDYDGDDLSYKWTLDGENIGDGPAYNGTLSEAGEYKLTLQVTDPDGETNEAFVTIMAGNAMPEVTWNFVGNRTFYWDNLELPYEVTVTDEEDGTVGDGIDPETVAVSVDFLERGADINEIVLGHQAQASVGIGKNMIANSDCIACHKDEDVSIGPAYKKVAERYADDPDARAYLIGKIKSGGGGVWGEVAMAAHPALSDEDAGLMVDYILSLGSPKPVGSIPQNGTIRFDQHIGKGTEGSYILSASYTDTGGDKIGPLTGRDLVVLRNPFIWAHTYDDAEKGMKIDVEAGSAPGVEEDITITLGDDGTVYTYRTIDLTGIGSVTFSIAQFPQYFKGGVMELVLDDPSGEVIGQQEIVQGLTDMGEKQFDMEIKRTEGVHDLIVKFSSEEGAVCAFAYMVFNSTK